MSGEELIDAAEQGNLAGIQRLVSLDPRLVAFRDAHLGTPLHHAVAWNHSKCAAALLHSGAEIEARTEDLCTPLHYATYEGHDDCIALLLRWGADRFARDREGLTPLDVLCGSWTADKSKADALRAAILTAPGPSLPSASAVHCPAPQLSALTLHDRTHPPEGVAHSSPEPPGAKRANGTSAGAAAQPPYAATQSPPGAARSGHPAATTARLSTAAAASEAPGTSGRPPHPAWRPSSARPARTQSTQSTVPRFALAPQRGPGSARAPGQQGSCGVAETRPVAAAVARPLSAGAAARRASAPCQLAGGQQPGAAATPRSPSPGHAPLNGHASPPRAAALRQQRSSPPPQAQPPPKPQPAELAPPDAAAAAAATAAAASSPPPPPPLVQPSELPCALIEWSELRFPPPDSPQDPLLGRGNYGAVHRATWRGVPVAVKELTQAGGRRAEEEFRREASMLAAAAIHRNVVRLLGVVARQPRLALVMELLERGSLFKYIDDRFDACEPLPLRLRWATETAAAMTFLHHNGILHRDLKSPNLLLDDDLHVKITDFGFSTTKSRSRGQAAVGTPCWMAPEIFAGQPFREAADVYSFGIVLWEVAAWEAPFAALTEEQVRARVAAGQRPDVAAAGGRAAPRGMVELMERCWAQRPEERPSFAEALGRLQEVAASLSGAEHGAPPW